MMLLSNEKLLTLSLLLRTLPQEQQSLLLTHFNPEVARRLREIEEEAGVDVEKVDWTPFYRTWPELERILKDCNEEIRFQKVASIAEEQRPKLREYMLMKLGRIKKGTPILISQDVIKIIDRYMSSL